MPQFVPCRRLRIEIAISLALCSMEDEGRPRPEILRPAPGAQSECVPPGPQLEFAASPLRVRLPDPQAGHPRACRETESNARMKVHTPAVCSRRRCDCRD